MARRLSEASLSVLASPFRLMEKVGERVADYIIPDPAAQQQGTPRRAAEAAALMGSNHRHHRGAAAAAAGEAINKGLRKRAASSPSQMGTKAVKRPATKSRCTCCEIVAEEPSSQAGGDARPAIPLQSPRAQGWLLQREKSHRDRVAGYRDCQGSDSLRLRRESDAELVYGRQECYVWARTSVYDRMCDEKITAGLESDSCADS